ncbi:hypothetical protein [Actinomyces polynesiensis]|uniref:hypothetical protein n=1 Tax=Actinomyces polynesiensis TaxID=1325934 RepID=UPI0018CDC561|nr:hypothetical protein [Actinomyces polynesiensis]
MLTHWIVATGAPRSTISVCRPIATIVVSMIAVTPPTINAASSAPVDWVRGVDDLDSVSSMTSR